MKITKEEKEFRKWCIEMAIKWPLIQYGTNHNIGQLQYQQHMEADIIKRANTIREWVVK